jgi:hypothetical protein
MRVIDEVDVVIHALDHERAFWIDTHFVLGLSQRRAVGGINRRTLDIDARLLEKDILSASHFITRKAFFQSTHLNKLGRYSQTKDG